ncbi:YfgM family protein [Ideonella sp.]|uniref:YfgM family protein n=1 Tax=Ideonella sp. TaxID=1929293 RepID=UPI003BB68746
MATNLDLQEQEQLDELKAFWNRYGNLILSLLTLVLAGFAAFNGWNWWEREQAAKAAAMFDEMEQAAQASDAEKSALIFNDLKERFPRTTFAQQAGLLAARVQVDKSLPDAARKSLEWVAEKAADPSYKALAQLRLSGLLIDAKAFDEALALLAKVDQAEFLALAEDRRGDVLLAQGKKAEAVAAWQKAYAAMEEKQDYRRIVDAKLTAQAAAPQASGVAK